MKIRIMPLSTQENDSRMTLRRLTLSRMTLRRLTLSRITLKAMTLSIMTRIRMIIRRMRFYRKHSTE